MNNYNDQNYMADRFLYFFLGGLIGAGAALLLAPQSGKETRDMVAQKAQEGKEYLVQKGQELKDQIIQKGQGLKEQGTYYVERGMQAADEVKDKLAQAAETAREVYQRSSAS